MPERDRHDSSTAATTHPLAKVSAVPSNYTLANTLQQIGYYREICGRDSGRYLPTAMELQAQRTRLDSPPPDPSVEALHALLDEADTAVLETLRELLRGEPASALVVDTAPLSILELTEIKGVAVKTARRAWEEPGVTDLQSFKDAVDNGTLAKTKGFGPKLCEKIVEHWTKVQAKKAKG